MTETVATRETGVPHDYYAPDYALTINGKGVSQSLKGDVLQIRVSMDLSGVTTADIRLNNYDDIGFGLKWSDDALFAISNYVDVSLGYAGALVPMLHGKITTLSPEFLSASDAATVLTVRVSDQLVSLKNSHPPEGEVTYVGLKDWQIVQRIAQRHGLRFVRDTDDDGPVHDLVVQRNTDDLTFIKERASRLDFDVYMRTQPKSGQDELHFGKPTDGRGAAPIRTYVLTWGSLRTTSTPPSLIEFKPTLSQDEQVQSVTVRGWDEKAKKAISYTAQEQTTDGLGAGAKSGAAAAKKVAGADGKNKIVINAPVATKEEARHLAESLFKERSYKFLTATGRVIGLPDLRPGDNVEIHGVGERFSGVYYVRTATHAYDVGGLKTDFEVRKVFEGKRR